MTIGFIGLGTMGASFAANLQKAGHDLVVHDVNRYDPPNFALELAHKDIALACELGREMDVPMRLVNLAREDMLEALNRGWGHRDSRSFLLLQQERAGVHIEESPQDVQAILDADPANRKG